MSQRTCSYDAACRLIAALQLAPMSQDALAEDCDIQINTVGRWLAAFRKAGFVEECGRGAPVRGGPRAKLWRWKGAAS